MLDFDHYRALKGVTVLKRFRKTQERCICLVAYPDGSRVLWRCYDRPVPAYERLMGVHCAELPEVYSYTATEHGCLVEEEFVDGLTLSELIRGFSLDERQTAAIAGSVCRALRVLHERNMVHRDVKPENILVTSLGRVVLIDLDAVSPEDREKDRDTKLLGTVGYAAPEQYGFGRSDGRADIFGVGVLMNVLLTGAHPAQQLADGALRKVIETCITVNVDQRYATVGQLLKQLPRVQAVRCPECGFVSPGGGCVFCGKHNASGGKQRKRIIQCGAAAVLLLLLLGLGGAAARRAADAAAQSADPAPAVGAVSVGSVSGAAEPEPSEALEDQSEASEDLSVRKLDSAPQSQLLTPFRYDLDADGIREEYYFGLLLNVFDQLTFSTRYVVRYDPDGEGRAVCKVVPAVWKWENDSYVLENGFRELLEDPEIAVFREQGEGLSATRLTDDVRGWRGGAELQYEYGSDGSWLVEATGVIDGTELSAAMPFLAAARVQQAPVRDFMLTDGVPVEDACSRTWQEVDRLIRDEVIVYGCSSQCLDNGYVRIMIDLDAPAGLQVTAFDPPDGAVFCYSGSVLTAGGRESLVFDLPEEQLQGVAKLTVGLQGKAGSCFYVAISLTEENRG